MTTEKNEVEDLAKALREAYAEHIGTEELAPWSKSWAQDRWRFIAQTAIDILKPTEPRGEIR